MTDKAELDRMRKAIDLAESVSNERTKLTATFVNGIAIALIAVGVFGSIYTTKAEYTWVQYAVLFFSLLVALGLHTGARWHLGGLK